MIRDDALEQAGRQVTEKRLFRGSARVCLEHDVRTGKPRVFGISGRYWTTRSRDIFAAREYQSDGEIETLAGSGRTGEYEKSTNWIAVILASPSPP